MHRSKSRLALILALILFLEPMVIPVYQVWGQEPRGVRTSELDMKNSEIDVSRFVKPLQILRDGLIQRSGYTKDLVYSRAWANWATLMSQAFLLYGREAHEVVTLERAFSPGFIKNVLSWKEVAVCAPKFLKLASRSLGAFGQILPLAFKELNGGYEVTNWAIGLQNIFGKWAAKTEELIQGNRILANLDAFAYPGEAATGFNKDKFVSAFTKAEGNTGLGTHAAAILGPVRVALGILAAYMLVTEAMEFPARAEYQSGLEKVLTGLGLAFDAIALFAFMLPQPYGTIVAVVQVIILMVQGGISVIKEWMAANELAYRDSYRFLMDIDPEFRSFSENESAWTEDIKSEGLKVLQEHYKGLISPEQLGGAQEVPLKRGVEGAMNQAKVMTYYNRAHPDPLATDIETMKRLWDEKKDYMRWRPTQRDRDFDEDLARQNWIGGIGMAWQNAWYLISRDLRERWAPIGQWWNRDNINQNIPVVWYNPDFYLYSQIKNYRDADLPNMERWIKFRFETAPYHFIPLVELPVDQWGTISGDGIILDAMLCDIYLSSLKSLKAMSTLIKGVAETLDEEADELRSHLTSITDELVEARLKPQAWALADLAVAYRDHPTDAVSEDLWDRLADKFELEALPEGEEKTPENIVRANRLLLQNHLNMLPFSLGNLQAQAMLYVDTAIEHFLLFKIFQREYAAKVKAEIEGVYSGIRNEKFKKLIDSGEYLTITSGWLSRPNKPKEEMEGVLKSISEEDGEAMKAFKDSVNTFCEVDDHPGMHFRGGGKILQRFRNGVGNAQHAVLKALQIWKTLEGRAHIRVQVPHNADLTYAANDRQVKYFNARDQATQEMFPQGYHQEMYQMPGGPGVEPSAQALETLESEASNDRAPAALFEQLRQDILR